MDLSDAAGLIVLAGRLLFATFFAWIAGMGHIRRSEIMKDYARSAGFRCRLSRDGLSGCGSSLVGCPSLSGPGLTSER